MEPVVWTVIILSALFAVALTGVLVTRKRNKGARLWSRSEASRGTVRSYHPSDDPAYRYMVGSHSPARTTSRARNNRRPTRSEAGSFGTDAVTNAVITNTVIGSSYNSPSCDSSPSSDPGCTI